MTCPLHTAPQTWCRECMPTLHAVRDALTCADCGYVDCSCRALHDREAHPLFEYETTTTGRKSGQSRKPDGKGWEPNMRIDNSEYREGVLVKEYRRNWDRFEFTDEEYWMRRKTVDTMRANWRAGDSLIAVTPVRATASLVTPSHDAQAARIAGLEANVNEKLATIAALESQLASESRAVLAARISALATALRKSLADVDPKAMSTYEQQQARREARALLEEVA